MLSIFTVILNHALNASAKKDSKNSKLFLYMIRWGGAKDDVDGFHSSFKAEVNRVIPWISRGTAKGAKKLLNRKQFQKIKIDRPSVF
jgi:hypothetical protein